jgi:hypothetical protein
MIGSNMNCSGHKRIQNFPLGGGGADPGAIYNLCLILKAMLRKSCQNLQADIQSGYGENHNRPTKNSICIFVSFIDISQYPGAPGVGRFQ